jgi:hypothetical protein
LVVNPSEQVWAGILENDRNSVPIVQYRMLCLKPVTEAWSPHSNEPVGAIAKRVHRIPE